MNTLFLWAEEYLKVVDRLWETENYVEGRKILESILEEEPGFAKAHSYAGWYAHYQLTDRKTARMHYEYALHFDPTLTYAYTNFANLLVEEKDEKRMKTLVESAMNHEGVDQANMLNNLGRILEMKNKYKEACVVYKAGLQFSMNEYTTQAIKDNRKRARSKYKMYNAWYSRLL